MRVTSAFFALALAVAGAAAGCGDDQRPEEADALWKRIHDEGYRSWSRAPGYESRRESGAPHGDMVEIYVNDVVVQALASAKPLDVWPDGSLIVKDGWSGDELELVAAMEKRGADWFWAEWDGEGSSKYSGKPALCTDCHEAGSDYVMAFSLPS